MYKSILVVQENELIRKIYRSALGELGCRVLTASTGREGLRVALESRPDLIIMDIVLDDANTGGDNDLNVISENPLISQIPLIALGSGFPDADEHGRMETHRNTFVQKPINMNMFVDTVREYLEDDYFRDWDDRPVLH